MPWVWIPQEARDAAVQPNVDALSRAVELSMPNSRGPTARCSEGWRKLSARSELVGHIDVLDSASLVGKRADLGESSYCGTIGSQWRCPRSEHWRRWL